MKNLALFLVVCLGGAAVALEARADDAGALIAHRLTGAIQIDGKLDDDAWRDAPVAGPFTQEAPRYGEAATSPTEVRVLYDDQFVYVGARMRHGPGAGRVVGL